MELHQVRYFLSVCETRNFTRAAERCHVSQPALTTAIRKLEAELAGELFHRERGRVLLTTLGESIRPHFERMVDGVGHVQAAAEKHRRLSQVPLRVGVLVTIGPARIGALLAAFHAQHRGVEVEVHPGSGEALRDRLDRGELDLAVVSARGEPEDPGIESHRLYAEGYRVLLPPGHRLAGREEISLAALSGEPYVDRLACELREMVMEACAERGVKLYAAFRSEREDWIQGMVTAGLGFAFLPEHSITAPDAVSRPLVDPSVAREISLVHPARRALSPAAAAFVRAARAASSTDPGTARERHRRRREQSR